MKPRPRPSLLRRLLSAPLLIAAAALAASTGPAAAAPPPAGQVTIAWHVTLSPSWFDPSTAPPQITPFGMMYAIHDALVKPMPGERMAPSLAESWTESEDKRVFEFTLRKGVKFHNGDPFTAEDVVFSFKRAKGVHFNRYIRDNYPCREVTPE